MPSDAGGLSPIRSADQFPGGCYPPVLSDFEYEPWNNTRRSEESDAINALKTAVHTATNYLRQCGNKVILPDNEDEFATDVLYNLLCRNESAVKPLPLRVQEVAAEYLVKGMDIDNIPVNEFIAPRSIEFTHGHYICIDGLYYAYLLVPSDGYRTQVPAGWLSLVVNAGDGSTWICSCPGSTKNRWYRLLDGSSESTDPRSRMPAIPIRISTILTVPSEADTS